MIIENKLSWRYNIYTEYKPGDLSLNVTGHLRINKSVSVLHHRGTLQLSGTDYKLDWIYCSVSTEVWGNTYITTTYPIFILQNKEIRIVNQSDYYEPISVIFIKSHTYTHIQVL